MVRKLATTLLLLLLPTLVMAQNKPVKQVRDAEVTGNVRWSADTVYVLNGFVFVEDGSTLTIEAGTVIKGKPGQGENASALIIARGGKIFAHGTPTKPIIFTAEADNVDDLNDLPPDTRGQWGGVIILGKARINVAGGEENIEGIPVTEPRGLYGGNDDDDNSGVFRYVSIRYGGTNIGANNEINGLTMGAVGRKTVIEYVEVFNNADDGYEWFGGTVNTRYLVSAFNDDDGFDWDEGFRGKGQFWFLIQDPVVGGSGGEHDGGTTPEDGQPYSIPIVYNATYIGSGAASTNARNDFALNIRDNSGGKYYNSIFTDFLGRGVQIDSLPATGENSLKRLQAGDIALENNIFFGFGTGSGATQYSAQLFTRNYLFDAANNNRFVNPQLRGISRTNDKGLDPRPQAGSPAFTGARSVPVGDDFFVAADYIGAFGNYNWAADWTFISQIGILTTDGAGLSTRVQERKVPGTIPDEYTLGQNYPNPFNPSTKIDYTVPKTGMIKLEVYNLLGQKVATLVEGIRTAGHYTVTWNATGLTSGMYFYRLEAGGLVQTRKMLLAR
ncbi:MAG: T9SS type A sorting domain-containing protein [candidate division KSB1 bacterium]|nr:T9SS type A sorting domain-containing protein [candidate division KSB1 bacterium]MDZ7301275.1 T9SS type A sorting domain-containing protein [candidate division KSB1 bacterium]MDZ7310840.1 T9SS type A sorting domain-containing protein [candidate division KSB1 bacterium]